MGLWLTTTTPDFFVARTLTPAMTQKLGTQLTSLTIATSEAFWPVMYQLQALTAFRLRTRAAPDSLALQPVMPAEHKMASLRRLTLLCCTASVSPLLERTFLSQLLYLHLNSCCGPGGAAFPEKDSVPRLQALTISANQVHPWRVTIQLVVESSGTIVRICKEAVLPLIGQVSF